MVENVVNLFAAVPEKEVEPTSLGLIDKSDTSIK
jgi:hypothetical protein